MSQLREIWPLANMMIRSARQIINRGLKPLGLSSPEGNILLHLLTQTAQLSQEDLVGQLEISKPAVSRALDALERKGYVVRTRDKQDRRINRVALTATAQAAGSHIEAVYSEMVAIASSALTAAESAQFTELFRRISSVLAAAAGSGDPGGA